MDFDEILSGFKKGDDETKISVKSVTDVKLSTPFDRKALDPELQEEFNKYLEMSKSENREDVAQALEWMDDYLILKKIVDHFPPEFIPALISFYNADFGECVADLLSEVLLNERYAIILVQNGIIDSLKEHFPESNSLIISSFLCNHQEGRKALIESGFLTAIDELFTPELIPDLAEQIAFFIAHVTSAPFTYDESVPVVFNILMKFMPFIETGELSILPSITRAFDNALNSNTAFIDLFMSQNLTEAFFIFNGNAQSFAGRFDDSLPKYDEEEVGKYLMETTSDVLDMFNAVVAYSGDHTDQLIVHNILPYLDDVFYFADDRVRIRHIILLSSLLESRPELISAFTVTSDNPEEDVGMNFHQMVADLAENQEMPARLVAESTVLLARMVLAAESLPNVMQELFDAHAFDRIVDNCELVAMNEEQLIIVKAITSITKLPHNEETESFMRSLADNSDFNEWIDEVVQNYEISSELDSHVQFLKRILFEYINCEED